jgi:hypothetical protein
MATDNTCSVCGAIGAASLIASVSFKDDVLDVGASLGAYLCATHRAAALDDLFIQCKANVEAAILRG